MNKHILILGNNKGLPGVKIDCENYRNFFRSGEGGYWYDREITVEENVTESWLNGFIEIQKRRNLDYFITIFSGHGGAIRNCTSLELSPNNEVPETIFDGIAPRQLSVFDCCRSLITEDVSASRMLNKASAFSQNSKIAYTRMKYDAKMMAAVRQHAKLYACEIGETAEDTRTGGVYTKSLLDSARVLMGDFKTVGEVHLEATQNVKRLGYKQNPDCLLPRCRSSQELILSINPNL